MDKFGWEISYCLRFSVIYSVLIWHSALILTVILATWLWASPFSPRSHGMSQSNRADGVLKRVGTVALGCGAIAFVLGLLVWEEIESRVARRAIRRRAR